MIPKKKIDRIREAWIPIRDADIQQQRDQPNQGLLRYNIRVPFERPFVDSEIFEHPSLVEFLQQVLEPDYVWSDFDSNVPLPGADYQKWHRDELPLLFGITTPAYAVDVTFP